MPLHPQKWVRENMLDFTPWPQSLGELSKIIETLSLTLVKFEFLRHWWAYYLNISLVIWRCSQSWRSQGCRRPRKEYTGPHTSSWKYLAHFERKWEAESPSALEEQLLPLGIMSFPDLLSSLLAGLHSSKGSWSRLCSVCGWGKRNLPQASYTFF
jgi:hypothetical protein